MKHLLLNLVSFLILSLVSFAGEITHTVRLPLGFSTADGSTYHSQSWYDVVQVPSFDTSLGTINRVELRVKQFTQFKFFYENLSSNSGNPVIWERINSSLSLGMLGAAKDLVKATYVMDRHSIMSGVGDGIMDWGGTGGYTSPLITRNRRGLPVFRMDQTILDYFSQPTVYLDVSGNSRFVFSSFDQWWAMGMRHYNGGELEITYHYI